MLDDGAEDGSDDNEELGGLFKVLKKQKGDGSRADRHNINRRDCNRVHTDDKKGLDEV